jgi:glyoxylase-like metal-dependent hydrolase (beta-lactamase superfamily II)
VRIHTAAAPPFLKNGFVVSCEDTQEAVVIDPGDEADALIREVQAERLVPKAILLTHAHLDHVTGCSRAKAALGVPIWLHRDDLFLYDGVVQQARMFGLLATAQPPIDFFYGEVPDPTFGNYVVDVRHTPGHCPGGVCLAIGRKGTTARELFVGDTLFKGSIGRTDLSGGDLDTLLHSIRDVLFSYPDDAVVHSGHGPDTTVGIERRTNPFLV